VCVCVCVCVCENRKCCAREGGARGSERRAHTHTHTRVHAHTHTHTHAHTHTHLRPSVIRLRAHTLQPGGQCGRPKGCVGVWVCPRSCACRRRNAPMHACGITSLALFRKITRQPEGDADPVVSRCFACAYRQAAATRAVKDRRERRHRRGCERAARKHSRADCCARMQRRHRAAGMEHTLLLMCHLPHGPEGPGTSCETVWQI